VNVNHYDSFNLTDTFNGLALRTRTVGGSSIQFDELVFKGQNIGSYNNNNTGSDPIVDWLLLSDFGDLSDGFTLNGKVTLDWTGAAPTHSNLAFQIKGANVAPVPLPGAALLLASGLLGLGWLKRSPTYNA
jgi:hypothetical protein